MFSPTFYVIATILISVGKHADSARVLGLFPHTGKSHQMVFEPLLHKLAERGHSVTVVSFFPLKNPPANYKDVSLEGIAPIGIEAIDMREFVPAPSIFKMLGIENTVQQLFAFHPLAEMALNVCDKVVDMPEIKEVFSQEYDVVLVENFNSDCMLGLAHAYGIEAPRIALLTSGFLPYSPERMGLYFNPAYTSEMPLDYVVNLTLGQKIQALFIKHYFKLWFRYCVQVKEQEMIHRSLGRRITDLQELALNTSAMIMNTHHSFHTVRPTVPGIIEAGGMHLNPNLKPIPKHIESFLNASDAGVILFSWGSLIRTSTIPADIEEVIVKTLNRFPQRVIWKYENSGPEGNLTGNILKVSWLPQYELLQHKKVIAFIGHGGLLGMTEAIAAGKPVLVIPFFGDQPNNGAMAEAAGIGTMLHYDEITEQTFYEAVKTILGPQVRMKAKRHSEIWRDRPMSPLDTAVYWVERVARWGHAAPLHLPARDMPLYQRALLDVIAVIVISILLVLFTIYAILKTVFRILRALFHTEPKKKVH